MIGTREQKSRIFPKNEVDSYGEPLAIQLLNGSRFPVLHRFLRPREVRRIRESARAAAVACWVRTLTNQKMHGNFYEYKLLLMDDT